MSKTLIKLKVLRQKRAIHILKNQLVQIRSIDKILNHLLYKIIKNNLISIKYLSGYMRLKKEIKSRRHQIVETLDGNTETGGDIYEEAREEVEYGNKTRNQI